MFPLIQTCLTLSFSFSCKLFHHATLHFVYISNPMRSQERDHVRWCFAPSGTITLSIVGYVALFKHIVVCMFKIR